MGVMLSPCPLPRLDEQLQGGEVFAKNDGAQCLLQHFQGHGKVGPTRTSKMLLRPALEGRQLACSSPSPLSGDLPPLPGPLPPGTPSSSQCEPTSSQPLGLPQPQSSRARQQLGGLPGAPREPLDWGGAGSGGGIHIY